MHLKYFARIDLKFQIKGHTRNSCDLGFGVFKKHYARNCYCTVEQLALSMNELQSLAGIVVPIESFFNWSGLGTKYGKVHALQSFQKFCLTSERPGFVSCQKESNDPIQWQQICNASYGVEDIVRVDKPKGLSDLKRHDFYFKVSKFVPLEFHNTLCPALPQEIVTKVRQENADKRQAQVQAKRQAKATLAPKVKSATKKVARNPDVTKAGSKRKKSM